MLSANAQLIKNLNQQIVLNLIHKQAPISGADLAKTTKLQPATISKILRALQEIGFIREAGIGASTKQGGKRPTLWRLDPGFGCIIGIEVLPDEMRGVLLDFESQIITRKTSSCAEQIQTENVIECVHNMVRALCNAARIPMKSILGAGLGVSGLVDSQAGVVKYSLGLGLHDYPLRDILEKKLRIDVIVDNDANAAAVGTKWMGCGVNDEHLVYITVNEHVTGIGCGIVLNGQLFRGVTGSAGELTLALPALRDLHNGQAETEKAAQASQDSTTMTSLVASARRGDATARRALARLGKVLAKEVARVIDFINPDSVIFGGDIVEAEDLILEPIQEEVKKLTLKLPYEAVSIRMTGFGSYAVAIGSAALVFKEIFKETQSAVRHVFTVPHGKRMPRQAVR